MALHDIDPEKRAKILSMFAPKPNSLIMANNMPMEEIIPVINNDWDKLIKDDFKDEKIQKLLNMCKLSTEGRFISTIFPPFNDLFSFLKVTPYKNVKVVILGQDPYINKNQANGMSFSVNPGERIPPSLMTVYEELHNDVGFNIPNNGYLLPWAQQGVLLMNCCLSVVSGNSRSHQGKGWELLTDHIISLINEKDTPVVFLLWGLFARSKKVLITNKKHLVLEAAHPSPLAHGQFNGCKHFSTCNEFLKKNGLTPINWQIPNI